ncbi:hypothetical protein ElyMa_002294800 [Elysia marginata]|uniref:Uncharacterized protein n=1 Tax=Elysia marginata TaxID=1093978 RepID=A0AAV4G2V0_9GAST|nr:hypothetical protein ElyMa_002294800 [Elysia marginata]
MEGKKTGHIDKGTMGRQIKRQLGDKGEHTQPWETPKLNQWTLQNRHFVTRPASLGILASVKCLVGVNTITWSCNATENRPRNLMVNTSTMSNEEVVSKKITGRNLTVF